MIRMLAVASFWRADPRPILLILLIAQAGDWLTTAFGVGAWGIGVEGNDFVVSLWHIGGPGAYLMVKLTGIALAGVGMWFGTTCDDAPLPLRLLVATSVSAMLAFGVVTGGVMAANNLVVIATGLIGGVPFI